MSHLFAFVWESTRALLPVIALMNGFKFLRFWWNHQFQSKGRDKPRKETVGGMDWGKFVVYNLDEAHFIQFQHVPDTSSWTWPKCLPACLPARFSASCCPQGKDIVVPLITHTSQQCVQLITSCLTWFRRIFLVFPCLISFFISVRQLEYSLFLYFLSQFRENWN